MIQVRLALIGFGNVGQADDSRLSCQHLMPGCNITARTLGTERSFLKNQTLSSAERGQPDREHRLAIDQTGDH